MPSPETRAARSRDDVLTDLAAAADLPVDDISPEEDFAGLGIDSVRLMRLLDQWRSAGIDVSFADLAGCRTVAEALDLVADPSAGPL